MIIGNKAVSYDAYSNTPINPKVPVNHSHREEKNPSLFSFALSSPKLISFSSVSLRSCPKISFRLLNSITSKSLSAKLSIAISLLFITSCT